jgi:hypothetical protein
MNFVADTVTLIRYLSQEGRIGKAAFKIMEETDQGIHDLDSRRDLGGDSLSVGEEQDTVGRTTIRSSV